MTQHDRLCHGLEAMGATKLPKRNKYTMFQLNRDGKAPRYYFVGSAGALRIIPAQNAQHLNSMQRSVPAAGIRCAGI
jgi:hypothetical protein